MKPQQIIHLFGWDKKFFPPFRQLIQDNFKYDKHTFIVYGDVRREELSPSPGTLIYPSLLQNAFHLSKLMLKADKIIIHGLFSNHLLYLLIAQPWLLKKCYWAIWGGDLYAYQKQKNTCSSKVRELYRSFVIKRIGHFITHIKGDYDLAREWYGAKGEWHECFMYPSNLYKDYQLKTKNNDTINIQVGNSADPSNNHTEILERLLPYKEQNIRIFTPLSYGDADYAEELIKFGNAHFGEKFIPLLKFMPFDEYLKLLSEIDIAIFNHKRQQAMGNSIVLSGLGKKVLMRNDVPQWNYLKHHGIKVYDNQVLDLNILSEEVAERNRKRVSEIFSKDNLLFQLNLLFSEN